MRPPPGPGAGGAPEGSARPPRHDARRRTAPAALRSKIVTIVVALLVLSLAGFLARKRFEKSGSEGEASKLTTPSAAVLAGYVIDAETREPLPGVTVTIQDWDTRAGRSPTATTDAAGRFRFDDLRPGPDPTQQVRLIARKSGYEPSYTDPLLGTTDHPIKLRPAAASEDKP